jgi:molybdopterin synthase catalytic subunit
MSKAEQVFVDIRPGDFDPGAEMAKLQDSSHGAIASFVGVVREFSPDATSDRLVIEHYPGMTDRVLRELAHEALGRWDLGRISMIHRVGDLGAGERIVWVGVSSRHREAAFDACRFLMDRLKTDAPFWKREQGIQGARWVEQRDRDVLAADAWRSKDE